MSDAVTWVLVLNVKDGQLDACRQLMDEMIEHTRDEPGAVTYEWFLSEDSASVHIHERYADTDAALAHLDGFGANYAKRFFDCFDAGGMFVYGDRSDEVRAALAAAGAEFFDTLGGFSR